VDSDGRYATTRATGNRCDVILVLCLIPRIRSVVNIDTAVRDTPHYLDSAIEVSFRILGGNGVIRLSLELVLGLRPDVKTLISANNYGGHI
jgi:hypothetical protein